MSAALKLSVVVPTHNRREVLISKTLPSMFSQDLPADAFEIIVVIDGSTDGTAEALRDLQPPCTLRWIEQPNRGASAARNNAIRAARGELLLFVDDDIICGPHLFAQHVNAHNESEPVVVFGLLSNAPGAPASLLKNANDGWYEKYCAHLNAQNGLKLPQDGFLISNSSIPRATLVSCGGFDEDLPAKEDYELGIRLWKQGMQFKYLPAAMAYEFAVKSWKSFLFNDGVTFGRAEVMLCRKHPFLRPDSELLSGLGRTVWWRSLLRRIAIRVPVSPAHLLSLPIWFCEKLCRFPIMQKRGLSLLGLGRHLNELRAACKEAGSWEKFQSEFAMRLPVLLYHHVGPAQPGTHASLTVSPARFERQVRWLARRGYQGVCPADWLRWRQEGTGLPDKPVLFTFDDGYAGLAEYALPVLRRYGFGAAVYIVTGQMGGTNAWDEACGTGTHRLMSAEQIRSWAGQGIEFGAHSRTHADLTTVPPDQLKDEVAGSGNDLEKLLGARVVSFAYPFGFWNEEGVESVRGTFELAFGISPENPGINHLLIDPHRLQRSMVQTGDSVIDVECRVRLGYSPIQRLRTWAGLRTRFKRVARAVMGGQAE